MTTRLTCLLLVLGLTSVGCGQDETETGGGGSAGTGGASGAGGSGVVLPEAPTRLRLFRGAVPPDYDLGWDQPAGEAQVATHVVYSSDAPFTQPDAELVLTEVPADARSAAIQLFTNSGVYHFRVAARDADGNEGPLSEAFVADTALRLTYVANPNREDTRELFINTPGNATPTVISGEIVPFSAVGQAEWSPDGRRIAFTGDRERLGTIELFLTTPGGSGEPTRISGRTGLLMSNMILPEWSPTGTDLVYTSDRDQLGRFRAYLAPMNADDDPVELGAGLPEEDQHVLAQPPAWLSDGRHVYVTVHEPGSFDQVSAHIVSIDGSDDPVELARRQSDTESFASLFGLSPDERWLAFLSDRRAPGTTELFVAPTDGSAAPVVVSGPIVAGGNAGFPRWSPDSSLIAFLVSNAENESEEVYVAPPDGSSPRRLMSGMPPGRFGAQIPLWSPDSTRLAFLTDKIESTRRQVYVATIAVGGEPAKVGGDPQSRGQGLLSWSPLGTLVAFQDEIDSMNIEVLRVAAPVDGSASRLVTGDPMAGGVDLQNSGVRWSPDGVFLSLTGSAGTGPEEQWIARADGSSPPTRISGVIPAGREVRVQSARWSSPGAAR